GGARGSRVDRPAVQPRHPPLPARARRRGRQLSAPCQCRASPHQLRGGRPMSRYRAVLFDLDGALLDTAPDFAWCLSELLRRHGRAPLAEAEIRAIVTDGSASLVARAFACAPDGPGFEAVRAEFLAIYADNLSRHTRPFPGIAELLARLGASGTAWGAVTNKPSRYALPLLADMALQPAAGARARDALGQ